MPHRLAPLSALSIVAYLCLGATESQAAFILNTSFSTGGANFIPTFTDNSGSVRLSSASQSLGTTGMVTTEAATQIVTPNLTGGGQTINSNNQPITIQLTITDTDTGMTSGDTIVLNDTLTGNLSMNPDSTINALVINGLNLANQSSTFIRIRGLTFTLMTTSSSFTYNSGSQGQPALPNGMGTRIDFPRLTFQVGGSLTAVPEPGSVILVGLGLGSAALVIGRSTRRRDAIA